MRIASGWPESQASIRPEHPCAVGSQSAEVPLEREVFATGYVHDGDRQLVRVLPVLVGADDPPKRAHFLVVVWKYQRKLYEAVHRYGAIYVDA